MTGKEDADTPDQLELLSDQLTKAFPNSDLDLIEIVLGQIYAMELAQLPISVDAVVVGFYEATTGTPLESVSLKELEPKISRALEVLNPATGLEEVRVMPLATLQEKAAGDPELEDLAGELEREGRAGLLLVEEGAVLPETRLDGWATVHLFAHPTVMESLASFLQSSGVPDSALKKHELPLDAKQMASQIQAAAGMNSQEGTLAIVGIASEHRAQLQDAGHVSSPLMVILDPRTWPRLDWNVLRAALARFPEKFSNILLDLSAGTVRQISIDGTAYYALDIAA